MKRTHWIFASAVLALAASPAYAHVLWSGDFSTGDLSQWTKSQVVSKDRLSVVTSPAPDDHSHAMKTVVDSGDSVSGGVRSEVVYSDDRPAEGDERYYHWKTFWPENYESPDYWQIFTQWHQYIDGGSPPLAFLAIGDEIMLGSPTTYFWTAPLERGVWHDFILHVVWSEHASKGGVEVWYDGRHVLPFTPDATLFANDSVYLKQGLYRKSIIDGEQVVYHSGMTVATSLEDVLPPPKPSRTSGETIASSTPATSEGSHVVSARAFGCESTGEALPVWALVVLAGCLVLRRRRATSLVMRGRERSIVH